MGFTLTSKKVMVKNSTNHNKHQQSKTNHNKQQQIVQSILKVKKK
jgi:hypothetical protein